MRTMTLIDVPKDNKSKRTKLTELKNRLGIETHRCAGEDAPWMAIHLPSARKFGYGVTETSDMFDCVSKVGRLLDEAGVCTYGKSEQDAVRQLCENLKLE